MEAYCSIACLFYANLLKIIRNGHILDRLSEEKAVMLCSPTQKFNSSSCPPEVY